MKTLQNSVQLMGRAGQDVELQTTQNGKEYTRFSLAINERYKTANGDYEENTHWMPVVAWGTTANKLSEKVKKGSKIALLGKLHSRNFETQNGDKKSVIEVLASEFVVM